MEKINNIQKENQNEKVEVKKISGSGLIICSLCCVLACAFAMLFVPSNVSKNKGRGECCGKE